MKKRTRVQGDTHEYWAKVTGVTGRWPSPWHIQATFLITINNEQYKDLMRGKAYMWRHDKNDPWHFAIDPVWQMKEFMAGNTK